MEILVQGVLIETTQIVDIYDIERDKKMFLNRDAGFVIQLLDGTKKVFAEKIPYESYPSEISELKRRWDRLMEDVIQEWQKHRHAIKEFKLNNY